MTQFDMFMTETEEIQDNIAEKMTVRRIKKQIIQYEGFELTRTIVNKMIQRAKEIFDEKNIIYPEGY